MIYLDYNATTPCAPEVLQEMLPYFHDKFHNSSATTYSDAWKVDEAIKRARQSIANCLQVDSKEIIFTSGATEAINTALKGIYDLYAASTQVKDAPLHIITCQTEHSAVLKTCEYLERYRGLQVTYLPVDSNGIISIPDFEQEITDGTFLAAISLANNETGVIQPISKIASICKARKIILFSDTTQAIGKIEVHPRTLGIDVACISGHKIYGPKGVGALYINQVQPRIRLLPLLHGGSQENERRAGTLNVPGIVGLGAAINSIDIGAMQHLKQWRERIEEALSTSFDTKINGGAAERLPQVSNISIEGLRASALIKNIHHELAISLGSACNASSNKRSHVLEAMGVPINYIDGAIRISLGKYTTLAEINTTIDLLKTNIHKLLQ